MTGAELIAAERQRQIDVEGWTPDRDAEYVKAELIEAAKTYAEEASFRVRNPGVPFDPQVALTIEDLHGFPASSWPWAPEWWKPSEDPVRNLVKAGALLAAEIDRLQAETGAPGDTT